ncbi:MAG TPA: 4Fe-4S dicluster domain-containing protein, partial [Candidatus Deferrimicrobium sp.]|nr:4Fe-4S dicluster domain-containing protein [Candidatus Deferrimicrobium sp.]
MPKGMFVDTSICTGCKACQVACKEWNALPHEPGHFRFDPVEKRPIAVNFTGDSYDNTGALGATDWRHVRFIEQFSEDRSRGRWLFASDSCKHCNDVGCLNACPTGAIVRTDLGNVFIRQDVCIGCKYCIPSCPFGVISLSEVTGTVYKCTLCNDRIHNGLGTACAKVCPTGSISFGEVAELRKAADKRLAQLKG